MAMNKRIPVSKERWKELSNMKEPGQTYDKLLENLIEEHKKQKLKQDLEKIEEEQEFTPIDEV